MNDKSTSIEQKFYRPAEVARMTGLDIRTIYRYMDEGKIKYRKPSHKVALISVEEYERWIASFEDASENRSDV